MLTYEILGQRSFDFKQASFLFLRTPVKGVVGGNIIWMSEKNPTIETLHIQAPQFLASYKYGADIHRALLPRHGVPGFPEPKPLTIKTLVRIATMPRNTNAHAETMSGGEWTWSSVMP